MSTDVVAPRRRDHAGAPRLAAALGLTGVLGTALLVAAMHVLAPWSRHDPTRRTISEYAVGPGGWLFDAAVGVLAVATVLVVVSSVRSGLVRWPSAPAVLLLVWSVGLALVIVFEKTNWSVGSSLSGSVHRYASLAAFVALPIGVWRAARPWRRDPRWGVHARVTTAFVALSGLAATPLVVALLAMPLTGTPWYRAVPLGLVERGLALSEVAALAALAVWAWRAARSAGPAPGPAVRDATG